MRAPRPRNPRVQVLKDLRILADHVKWSISPWRVRSTILLSRTEQTDPWVWERKRRPEEYPEVQPKRWRDLINEMAEISRRAEAIAIYATGRLRELEAKGSAK